jgi:hypothetical protein
MPGLMARILSRRANGAPPPAPDSSEDAPTVVVPAAGSEQATAVVPAVERSPEGEEAAEIGEEAVLAEDAAPVEETAPAEPAAAIPGPEVPAGAEAAPPPAPTFLTRGKLRRRLRYLRRVREIGFRDLGGLVFDLDRFGRERPDLVALKLAGLKSIDAELRALEIALEDLPAAEELAEPGISACVRCGALHGSEARFCPSCGVAVDAPPPAAEPAAELPATAPATAPESAPAPDQPAA